MCSTAMHAAADPNVKSKNVPVSESTPPSGSYPSKGSQADPRLSPCHPVKPHGYVQYVWGCITYVHSDSTAYEGCQLDKAQNQHAQWQHDAVHIVRRCCGIVLLDWDEVSSRCADTVPSQALGICICTV